MTKRPKQKLSKQRRYQLRNAELGKCRQCSLPAKKCGMCEYHYENHKKASLESYHRRKGSKGSVCLIPVGLSEAVSSGHKVPSKSQED